jgi:hypothetical protein
MRPTVFVSRPAVLTPDQEAVCARWCDGLAGLGLALITIPRACYSSSPWDQLRNALSGANGAVILGFRQTVVERGRRCAGTPEQESAAGWYASAWNQIEAGLAVMAKLPVLVVPEGDARDGVFAADLWRDGVYGTQMELWTAGEGARDESLRGWATDVCRDADSRCSLALTPRRLMPKPNATTVDAEGRDDRYARLEAAVPAISAAASDG